MLILAGVSLNALVGDNGIIKQAQSTTIRQSIAILEEFLQEQYVGEYELGKDDKKLFDVLNNHPEFFYIPRNEGYGGLDYIEQNGKSLYLIKKSGLPTEIQKSIRGGEAGDGNFVTYSSCLDVYGVTEDLKVYYCENGMDTIIGINKDEIDKIKDREVFTASSGGLSNTLSAFDSDGDGVIASSEVSSIKSLEITENVELKDLFNLYSLKNITFKNVSNVDLSGIENCSNLNYIMFFNSSANEYTSIGKIGSRLNYLYFVNPSNETISKFGEDCKNYDLTGLQYLGAWGNTSYTYGNSDREASSRSFYDKSNKNNLTTLEGFSKLSINTKNAVKYLYIENNKLETLKDISEYKNLIYLRAWGNKLTNVEGISGMKSLTHLQLARNNFTDNETRDVLNEIEIIKDALYYITGCTNLKWLDLSVNTNLIWISYLKDLPLQYLYLDDCGKLSKTDIHNQKEKINNLLGKTVDASYNKILLDSSKTTYIDYQNQTISITDFKNLGECTLLNYLDLANCKVVKEESEVLSADENTVEKLMIKVFSKLKRLNILSIQNLTINLGDGARKINNLNFIQLIDSSNANYGLAKTLRILDLRDTDIIARGDTTGETNTLGTIDNNLSKSNTNMLSALNGLKVLVVNTDKYDWSKMQGLINHLNSGWYPGYGKYWYNRGLICLNMTSLKTLEKCSEITRLVSFSYLGAIGENNAILDLSNCNKLTYVNEYSWRDMYITYPSCIKSLGGAGHYHHYAFEEGTETIDEIILDETNYSYWGRSVKEIANSGVHVKKLNINSIYSEGNLNVFLNDKTGKCDWLDRLFYNFASWGNWIDNTYFYDNIGVLIGSSIKEVSVRCCAKEDLNWLGGFENQLTRLSVYSSKIKNISKLSGFKNLEYLNLNNNAITDISSISNLTNLKELYLNNNQISKGVENIDNLTSLEMLDLRYNNLAIDKYTDIATGNVKSEFINKFVKLHTEGRLKKLYLNNTGLKNIRSILNVSPNWEELSVDS